MSDGNGARQEVPYKELDYFEENIHDRERFAGRDHDIEEVVARISSTRAFVLYGRSGLGKTSLLLSGVFPILRKEGFLPIYVRTLDQPLQGLEKILRHPCSGLFDSPARDDESLEDLLRRAGGKSIPVLVFDQFEEFFTRFALRTDGFLKKRRDRTEFVNRICALVLDLARDIRIVFSLREDYLHTLDAFQRRLPNLFSTAYRLLPLTADGARDAIIRPLRRDGVAFDQRAVTGLVDQLAEFDFESARLQVASAELYLSARGARDGKVSITADDLGRLKEHGASGLSGVFKRYLQAAIEHIEERWHLLARALLDVLFLAKGTKFALSSRELVDYQFGTALETLDVLRQLTRQKILRRERRDGRTWFELRHECLVEPIEEWLNESESFGNYRQVRDIIKANARGGRFRTHPEMLLSTDQLDRLVSPNKERFRLSAQEIEFVTLSAIYERSADVGWWADKMGKEETEKLLTGLLADESNHKMLLGAAEAVGKAGFQNRDLSQRCLAMALNKDTPSEVQRAAGLSFATIAGEDEVTGLRSKINSKAVRELFGDLHEKGRLRGRFNQVVRFVARRRWERRLFDRRISTIREISGETTLAGGVGGGIWALTVGLFVSYVVGNFNDSITEFFVTLVVLGALSVSLGLLMGLLCGTSAAQESAIHGVVNWGRAVRRQYFMGIAGAFCSFWIAIGIAETQSSWLSKQWEDLPNWVSVTNGWLLISALVPLGTVAFFWLLSWAVQFLRLAMMGETRQRAIFWSIPTLITVGIFLPMGIHRMTFMLESVLAWGLLITSLAFGLIVMGAVAAFNTADHTMREAINSSQRLRRNLVRGFSLLGAICVIPCLIGMMGWNSLPLAWGWLYHPPEENGKIQYSVSMKMWPTVSRFAIEPKDLVYRMSASTSSEITVNGDRCGYGEVFFPEHRAEVLFHCSSASNVGPQEIVLSEGFVSKTNPYLVDGIPFSHMLEFSPQDRDDNKTVWATPDISTFYANGTKVDSGAVMISIVLYSSSLTSEAGQDAYKVLIDPAYEATHKDPSQYSQYIIKHFRAKSRTGVLASSGVSFSVWSEANGSIKIPFKLERSEKSKTPARTFSMVVGIQSSDTRPKKSP